MNKLFWSTFAMSLILISNPLFSQDELLDDFAGLESDIKPELQGNQNFSPRELHHTKDWNLSGTEVEEDTRPLKGQKYSLVNWEDGHESLLSIQKWMVERDLKDKLDNWKLRLRDERQHEQVGKVLQCRGSCEIYRGVVRAKVQHLSRVQEGDEFRTDPDTVAWIYLMDGTLMRVGPSSAVSFQEINWSKKEVFHLVRLHHGHVFWHPRSQAEYTAELSPETDPISLPLLVREANQTYFERVVFHRQRDSEQLEEVAKTEDTAMMEQIKKINELRTQNNQTAPAPARVMLVAPNGTLVGKQTSFDFVHTAGGKSYYKKRHPLEGHELSAQLRGYAATDTIPVTEEAWFELEANGRSSVKADPMLGPLDVTELLTKRIKTLELAREFWFEKYTAPVVKALEDPKALAINHGYSLWGDELSRRFDFLVEYTRRMETTNLKSMDNLLKKSEANGEVVQKEISDSHYRAALEYYLLGLKSRFSNKRMQVREMNNLQYYVWILRHGKHQN